MINFEIMKYIVLCAILFLAGFITAIIKKNNFIILMGIIIAYWSVVLLFTVLGKFLVGTIEGQVLSFFLFLLGSVTYITGLALIVRRRLGDDDVKHTF